MGIKILIFVCFLKIRSNAISVEDQPGVLPRAPVIIT